MGIGGALAEARSEAGLTVDQVSQRTRIRATIIRAIEQDDYALCGGDFYTRGHIRAIARAVGADPVPLIREYDLAHQPPPGTSADNGAGHGTPPVRSAANGQPWPRPGGITAAEAFRPAMPLRIEGARRLPVRAIVIGVVALALIITLIVVLGSPGAAPAPARSHGGTHHAALAAPAHSSPAASQAPSPSPSPLPVASAAAFGPGGPSQGDYPQGASYAIDGSSGTFWHTDWYAQSNLNGQPGTGLLLDMGATVSVSAVQVLLGPAAGGTIELRAGNSPALAGLPVVAQAAIPGGTVSLQPSSPVSARYVLIWFTQLPPDSAGTYQAYVYNVTVSGTG